MINPFFQILAKTFRSLAFCCLKGFMRQTFVPQFSLLISKMSVVVQGSTSGFGPLSSGSNPDGVAISFSVVNP